MNKTTKAYFAAGILFVLFIIYTAMIKMVDVQTVSVGTEKAQIGFAGLNTSVFEALGQSDFWYKATKLLGALAIGIIGIFGVLGLGQMIVRKNFFRVDPDILALGAFYVVMAGFYVLFEKVVINVRPVLEDGQLEASYPSSHTLLVCCVIGSAMVFLAERNFSFMVKLVGESVMAIIILVMAIGRLLSGVHWFTDIIGGILISAALVTLYAAVAESWKSRYRR